MTIEAIDMAEYGWIPVAGFIVTFYCAWGGGANDCANSFSSTVGSGAINLRQAVIIASIFEMAGVLLMGSHVSNTVRKNIIDIDLFTDDPADLMFGMFCAILSSGIWLMVATYFKWAVSTTHTIIGSILGFGIAAHGWDCVQWSGIIKIVLSWLLSPLISGILSALFFVVIRNCILRKKRSAQRLIKFYPTIIVVSMVIYALFIVYKGSPQLNLKETPLWVAFLISLGIGAFCALLAQLFYVPYLRRRLQRFLMNKGQESQEKTSRKVLSIKKSENQKKVVVVQEDGIETKNKEQVQWSPIKNIIQNNVQQQENKAVVLEEVVVVVEEEEVSNVDEKVSVDSSAKTDDSLDSQIKESQNQLKKLKQMKADAALGKLHGHAEIFAPETEDVCKHLQIFTACCDTFAHGANDVANSIGPYAAVVSIYQTGLASQKSDIPIWILLLGGGGLVIGLATWGYKIIERMGKQMTKITPSRGGCIELGSTCAVIIASRLGLPVSTTHCQVGSVYAVGLLDGVKNVNNKVLLQTVLSWVATLPAAGLLTAAFYLFGVKSPSDNNLLLA